MEAILNQILSEIKGMKADIVYLKESQSSIEQKIDGIYKAVVRIEEGQPKDIFAILENINQKLDTKESEINVLNKRIFKVETEIERL